MSENVTDVDRITLWTRAAVGPGDVPKRDRALKRIRRLERDGDVSIDVSLWEKTIDRSNREVVPDAIEELVSTLDSFADWAQRTGRSLDPFFTTRRLESTVLVESQVVQRLPTVALAEYRDGELVHVAPSRIGDRIVDVLDRLDRIESNGSKSDGETASYDGEGVDEESADDPWRERLAHLNGPFSDGKRGGSAALDHAHFDSDANPTRWLASR